MNVFAWLAPQISETDWQRLNQRRHELIDKEVTKQANALEKNELQSLQRMLRAYDGEVTAHDLALQIVCVEQDIRRITRESFP